MTEDGFAEKVFRRITIKFYNLCSNHYSNSCVAHKQNDVTTGRIKYHQHSRIPDSRIHIQSCSPTKSQKATIGHPAMLVGHQIHPTATAMFNKKQIYKRARIPLVLLGIAFNKFVC